MRDAWKKLHDLLNRYTKEWDVRPDLSVTAHATDRGVEIQIGKRREDYRGKMDGRGEYAWQSSGPRNVSTMRELAAAIITACDFVDESNPKWADHHQ